MPSSHTALQKETGPGTAGHDQGHRRSQLGLKPGDFPLKQTTLTLSISVHLGVSPSGQAPAHLWPVQCLPSLPSAQTAWLPRSLSCGGF